MGILGITVTQDERAFKQRVEITDSSNKLYYKMDALHKRIFNMVWNANGLTAQEVLDEYGTEAKDLFIFSSKIQDMLLSINPDYIALETPNFYTVNEDGTVTVGDLKN